MCCVTKSLRTAQQHHCCPVLYIFHHKCSASITTRTMKDTKNGCCGLLCVDQDTSSSWGFRRLWFGSPLGWPLPNPHVLLPTSVLLLDFLKPQDEAMGWYGSDWKTKPCFPEKKGSLLLSLRPWTCFGSICRHSTDWLGEAVGNSPPAFTLSHAFSQGLFI